MTFSKVCKVLPEWANKFISIGQSSERSTQGYIYNTPDLQFEIYQIIVEYKSV